MCPYSLSECVGHSDYHFCGTVSDSMPCQKVRKMFVQYAPFFIMTLSEYVPISFVGKHWARWLSLLLENNDRWTQDKHLASCPMQLIIWRIHSNDRSPRCALPHVRCMISIDACMHCPSVTWTSLIWFKCTVTLESGVLHWFYWSLPTYNHFPSFVRWPFIQCQSSRTLDPNPTYMKSRLYKPDEGKGSHMLLSKIHWHYQLHLLVHHLQKKEHGHLKW